MWFGSTEEELSALFDGTYSPRTQPVRTSPFNVKKKKILASAPIKIQCHQLVLCSPYRNLLSRVCRESSNPWPSPCVWPLLQEGSAVICPVRSHCHVRSVVLLSAECYYPSLHRKIRSDFHRPVTESMLLKILRHLLLKSKSMHFMFWHGHIDWGVG